MVYFVAGKTSKLIKIGMTNSCKICTRLNQLSYTLPEKVVLLAITKEFKELELHKRFAHLRHHGEWFNPAQELVDFISTLPPIPVEVTEPRKFFKAPKVKTVSEKPIRSLSTSNKKNSTVAVYSNPISDPRPIGISGLRDDTAPRLKYHYNGDTGKEEKLA